MLGLRTLTRTLALPLLVAAAAHGQIPATAIRTVDAGATPVRVATAGLETRSPGAPVLVLLSGAATPLESWGPVFERLRFLGPVVAYDRPGIGESPFDRVAPTPQKVAKHLHALLAALGVPPPYVLVAHSWGGPLALVYAGAYPDEIVGLAYLEPMRPSATIETYLPHGASPQVRAAARAEWESFWKTEKKDEPEGVRAESAAIEAWEATPIADRGLSPLPTVPTAVILGILPEPIDGLAYWDLAMEQSYHRDRIEHFSRWVRELPKATLFVLSDSGHFVHHAHPDLVADAVEHVYRAALASTGTATGPSAR